ncbi:MAG: PRC-barrel domain-containing protein [Paracoccaceae bacterium]
MKRLFASTAIAALLAAPAFAQSTSTSTAPATDYGSVATPVAGGTEIIASDFIGRYVYAGQASTDAGMADPDAEWENIGEVSDVLFTKEGAIAGVLVDVGGFLGLGEHRVNVSMDTLSIVQDSDDPDTVFIVSSLSKEELEAQPAYDAAAAGELGQGRLNSADRTADTAAATGAATGAMTGAATGSAVGTDTAASERVGDAAGEPVWVEADLAVLTADDLQGASVSNVSDERIGEIDELIVDKDGKITDVIVDVGGFLGIGEKPVALGFDKLNVMQSEDGGEFHVIINETNESLEAMPAYES